MKNGTEPAVKDLVTIRLTFASEEGKKSSKGGNHPASPPPVPEYSSFTAKPKELCQTPAVWYYGVGNLRKINSDTFSDMIREVTGKAVQKIVNLVFDIPPELFEQIGIPHLANIFSVSLGTALYPVDFLKSKPAHQELKIKHIYFASLKKYHPEFIKQFKKCILISKHINAMRQTQALPGNYFTPQTAGLRAKQIADQFDLKLKILDKKRLLLIGAGGILAVSEGSVREPSMIILEYKPASAKKTTPTLALVGKGVTFDTGGISIKPSKNMHEMKYDMSGSGAALHAVAAIAELKLPVHAVAVVGMVENMPGSAAFKPGDVYTALNGKTIEVQNTDAEGRLVLGDLLHYAEKNYKPDLMINLATLTGACMVGLGQFYAGCFSRQEKVLDLLNEASIDSMEPIWPLPLSERFYRAFEVRYRRS